MKKFFKFTAIAIVLVIAIGGVILNPGHPIIVVDVAHRSSEKALLLRAALRRLAYSFFT